MSTNPLYVILPGLTKIQPGVYPDVAYAMFSQALMAQVHPGYVYGNSFQVTALQYEGGASVQTGFSTDFVEDEASNFVSGTTREEAWAKFHARK